MDKTITVRWQTSPKPVPPFNNTQVMRVESSTDSQVRVGNIFQLGDFLIANEAGYTIVVLPLQK